MEDMESTKATDLLAVILSKNGTINSTDSRVYLYIEEMNAKALLAKDAAHKTELMKQLRVLTDIRFVDVEWNVIPGAPPCMLACPGRPPVSDWAGAGTVFPALHGSDYVEVKVACVDPSTLAIQCYCNEVACYVQLVERMSSPPKYVAIPIGTCSVFWRHHESRPWMRYDDHPMRPALVMELLLCSRPGSDVVRVHLINTDVNILDVFDCMAGALEELHRAGIVHYDINVGSFVVMVRSDDPSKLVACKVFDLSRAKRVGIDDAQMHKPDHIYRRDYPYLPEDGPAGVMYASCVEAATPWLDVYALGNVFDQIRTNDNRKIRNPAVDTALEAIATNMRNPSFRANPGANPSGFCTASEVMTMLTDLRSRVE